jgi:hypothetical protein
MVSITASACAKCDENSKLRQSSQKFVKEFLLPLMISASS